MKSLQKIAQSMGPSAPVEPDISPQNPQGNNTGSNMGMGTNNSNMPQTQSQGNREPQGGTQQQQPVQPEMPMQPSPAPQSKQTVSSNYFKNAIYGQRPNLLAQIRQQKLQQKYP